MLKRRSLPAALALLLCMAGCAQHGAETQIRYQRDEPLVFTAAPQTGDYALIVGSDTAPRLVQHVNQGERLGFEKTGEERIRAVAGPNAELLPSSAAEARWELRR